MKMMWSEPQLTEIEVKMTEYNNKIGNQRDSLTGDTGLCGDIVPCDYCS